MNLLKRDNVDPTCCLAISHDNGADIKSKVNGLFGHYSKFQKDLYQLIDPNNNLSLFMHHFFRRSSKILKTSRNSKPSKHKQVVASIKISIKRRLKIKKKKNKKKKKTKMKKKRETMIMMAMIVVRKMNMKMKRLKTLLIFTP